MSGAVVGALWANCVALIAAETSLTLADPGTVLLQWIRRTADSMARAEVQLSWAL